MRGAYLPEKLTLNDTNFKIKMIIRRNIAAHPDRRP